MLGITNSSDLNVFKLTVRFQHYFKGENVIAKSKYWIRCVIGLTVPDIFYNQSPKIWRSGGTPLPHPR